MFNRVDFNFEIPTEISECINRLEEAVNNNSYDVDLIQDELRQLAHQYEDDGITEEEANEIIHCYCNRFY